MNFDAVNKGTNYDLPLHNAMTRDQLEFFTGMMDAIKEQTTMHPSITNADCVAILSRMIGMAIARSGVEDRPMLLKSMNDNVRKSVEMFE